MVRTPKKVMILDDDEEYALFLKDALAGTVPTWEIKVTTNVFDAGHVLVTFLPDLAVMDIRLPAVPGYDICKFIKNNPALRHTRIIAMSSHDIIGTREKIISSGADIYLPKPIDIDTFITTAKNLTEYI